MEIQKEWDLFVAHLRSLGVVKIGLNALGVITNLTREGNCSLGYNDIELMWKTWQAAKAQAVLKNDCMIGQTWFMKNTPVSALIKHAEDVYKAETVAQNSKIEFGTDDNEHWFAHDVPFYGLVQIDRIEERHGLIEWDIHFNDCWQGPFNSKSECIKHLEECIAEQREEAQEQADESI